jgi:hypothetical protein
MPPELLTLYRFTLAMCERLMVDVSQEEMEQQPTAGVNPPAWIVGHLAICTDFALKLMGKPARLPATWHEEFGPGSSPLPQKHSYPSREELMNALRTGHAEVMAALPEVDRQRLAAPNPFVQFPFLTETLPTVGDVLAHLLSTHEAAHLGHLSNWRRQLGRKALF